MPRVVDLTPEAVFALSEADSALGHLRGLTQLLRKPQLFVGPYLTREALASSRIEGTEASLSDVLKAEASGGEQSSDQDVAEVERYLAAARRAFGLLETLPISQRLILEAHKVLMTGVRGKERLPGQLRTSPVWVGSSDDRPDTALFVPPLPEELPALITDWEQFVNEPSTTPVLIRCALMHYQFETIHPFLDGNGRIGRLLIGLMLIKEHRLDEPLLYVSGYLESHRREYYDRLQAVREQGDILSWIRFFCTAVRRSADDAVARATQLVQLRETYLDRARNARSSIGGVIDLIITNPILTVERVQVALQVSGQGARNLVKQAESLGWVRPLGTYGRGGRHYWIARAVFDIIEADVAYGRESGSEPEPDNNTAVTVSD
jgi:Fic family protein